MAAKGRGVATAVVAGVVVDLGGVPAATEMAKQVRMEALRKAQKMLHIAIAIAQDEGQRPDDRLRAVGMVLDRALGRPVEQVRIEDESNAIISFLAWVRGGPAPDGVLSEPGARALTSESSAP